MSIRSKIITQKVKAAKRALGQEGQVATSIMSALLFFIMANPWTFKMVNQLLGWLIPIADENGCPTLAGLLINSLVYGLLVYFLMRIGSQPAK